MDTATATPDTSRALDAAAPTDTDPIAAPIPAAPRSSGCAVATRRGGQGPAGRDLPTAPIACLLYIAALTVTLRRDQN